MNDELLKKSARALRHETADEESGRFTRARVMASLHQTQIRRRTRLAFALPLVASFAAATAWGTVSGRAPEIARSVVQALGFTVDPTEPAPATGARSKAPRAQSVPAKAANALPPGSPASEQQAAEPAPAAQPTQGSTAPEPSRVPENSAPKAPAGDPTHELYRLAHRLHFVEQNCPRAIEAWSAYLNATPAGRFSPEARYNRALCLVRLGQRAPARAALEPFARGQYGTYRQSEARALLEALDE